MWTVPYNETIYVGFSYAVYSCDGYTLTSICIIALSSDLWMCVCLTFFELNCTPQTRGHPYKLYKPRTYNTVRAFALSMYGIVCLLIVLISPRLLPLNALLNRLILLRFYCVITFDWNITRMYIIISLLL